MIICSPKKTIDAKIRKSEIVVTNQNHIFNHIMLVYSTVVCSITIFCTANTGAVWTATITGSLASVD